MKKKIMVRQGVLIALVAIFLIATGTITAIAYWAGTNTLSKENTLTIGTTETGITLGNATGSGTSTTEWYQGTTADFIYTVDINNVDGDVTIKALINTEAADDFTVALFISSDDGSTWSNALANDGTDVVEDGDKVKVTVTLTATSKPSYESATLRVELTDPTA